MQMFRNIKAYVVSRTWARRTATVFVPMALVMVGSTSGAYAVGSSTDLTNGSGDTFFTKITAYFTGHVLVSVLALLAITVGSSVLISWAKRAAKSR